MYVLVCRNENRYISLEEVEDISEILGLDLAYPDDRERFLNQFDQVTTCGPHTLEVKDEIA